MLTSAMSNNDNQASTRTNAILNDRLATTTSSQPWTRVRNVITSSRYDGKGARRSFAISERDAMQTWDGIRWEGDAGSEWGCLLPAS